MGPNDENRILVETNDVSFITSEGRETTTGALVWQNSEAGERAFTVRIKPHAGWEVAKRFIIELYDIRGFPASGGIGEPSPTAGQVTLTVSYRSQWHFVIQGWRSAILPCTNYLRLIDIECTGAFWSSI